MVNAKDNLEGSVVRKIVLILSIKIEVVFVLDCGKLHWIIFHVVVIDVDIEIGIMIVGSEKNSRASIEKEIDYLNVSEVTNRRDRKNLSEVESIFDTIDYRKVSNVEVVFLHRISLFTNQVKRIVQTLSKETWLVI